eukprot:c23086_g1_i1 orf=183-1346(+)
MGGESEDIERKGSMGRRSSRGVHPVQEPFPVAPGQVAVDESHLRKRYSWLIPLFLVANVTMFVIVMYVNNCPRNIIPGKHCVVRFFGRLSFQPLSENPLLGPSSTALEDMGALEVNKVVHDHQGWRLITCVWLHAGVVHLLANMLGLLFIGIRLEQEFGFLKIGIVYLLSGYGGSLLSALFLQKTISVGASGALFGLLGAMLSELITNWTIYANKCAALSTLVLIVALNLGVGILPHVDNFAHIGGFISGFLLGFILLVRPQLGWVDQANIPPGYEVESPIKSKHKAYQYIFWVMALVVLIAWLAVATVMVFRGVNANDHCSWCHYLSCVPTSRWSCDDSNSMTCNTTIGNNSLILTCQSNNKTQSFQGMASESDSRISQLCAQLCT